MNEIASAADVKAGMNGVLFTGVQPLRQKRGVTRVISVTSGKGGVGKTSTVVNLAIALAHQAQSVLVFDADYNLANVDVMLGLTPRRTISDVLEGRCSLADIVIPGPAGISVLPAASGVGSIDGLTVHERITLLNELEKFGRQFDYLLIDTQAGIGSDVMQLNSVAHRVVCVINSEPTSLTDSYALIKVLAERFGKRDVSILSNNVVSEDEGRAVFQKMDRAVERFLGFNLEYMGSVPKDGSVSDSIRQQRAVVEVYPSSPAARAWQKIAGKLEDRFGELRLSGGMQLFFEELLQTQETL